MRIRRTLGGDPIAPPVNVMRALMLQAAHEGKPGHGSKTQKRRSKRRRLRRRERVLQRTTWRAFHEEEKRRANAPADRGARRQS